MIKPNMDSPLRKPVNLPAEVWLDVFRCLRAVDLRHSCARVSRSWNKIVAENLIMLTKYRKVPAEQVSLHIFSVYFSEIFS